MSELLFQPLASGSTGNCSLLIYGETKVLFDAGISCRRITLALKERGLSPEDLSGICVTHEHSDHISGLPQLVKKFNCPLYGNAGTIQGLSHKEKFQGMHWHVFTTGQTFSLGDLRIHPYAIPHDAMEPVGFVVEAGEARLGLATDMGLVTRLARDVLQDCDVLLLEANHDPYLLDNSQRPYSLKQRIAGRQGHLCNEDAASLLRDVAGPRLKQVFAAHLSKDCNEEGVALAVLRRCLKDMGRTDVAVHAAKPDQPIAPWRP